VDEGDGVKRRGTGSWADECGDRVYVRACFSLCKAVRVVAPEAFVHERQLAAG
jgi:hypothetical protein